MTVGAARPARRGTIRLTVVLAVLVVVNLYVFLWRKGTSLPDVKARAEAASIPGPRTPAQNAAPTAGSAVAGGSGSASAAPAPKNTVVDGKVKDGDSLGKLLKREGLPAADADEVIRALHDVLDFKSLRAGQKYTIERASDGSVVRFELVVSKTLRVSAARGADGALEGRQDQDQVRSEVDDVGGRVTGSLYATIKNLGEKPALAEDLADLFAYDLDFYVDVHDGDTFRCVVEKQFKDQELLGYGHVVAAEWAGKAGKFRAFFWKGKWYDDQGRSLEKTLLKTPLKFARISSGFDLHRFHPILHVEKAHMGVDYAAPTGTPVWAAAAGVVESVGPAGGAGNLIVLKHDGGLETLYMHLSKFAKGLHAGQRVAAKTVIGYVGATGLATGPHLHFGVKKDGSYVDPLKLAPQRGPGVSAAQRPQFLADTSGLAARLDHIAVAPAAPAAPPGPQVGLAPAVITPPH